MGELGLTFVLVTGGVWRSVFAARWFRKTAELDRITGLLCVVLFATHGADGELVGVIRYRELSGVLFDPSLGSLVRAADLTTATGRVLHPDDTIDRACEIFSSRKDDCIPVVTREKPQIFLGLVRRRDILRMLFRGRGDGSGE